MPPWCAAIRAAPLARHGPDAKLPAYAGNGRLRRVCQRMVGSGALQRAEHLVLPATGRRAKVWFQAFARVDGFGRQRGKVRQGRFVAALGTAEAPAPAHLFRHDEKAVDAMAAAFANALVHGSLRYPGRHRREQRGRDLRSEIGAGMFPDRQRR